MLKESMENKRLISNEDLPKAKKLATELHEKYPEVKPRLTFPFPLSQNRKDAIEMIQKDEIDIERSINLLDSKDFVEQWAGLYFLSKVPTFSIHQQNTIIKKLKQQIDNFDYAFKESDLYSLIVKVLGNFDKQGLKYINVLSDRADILEVADSTIKINTRHVVVNPEKYLKRFTSTLDHNAIVQPLNVRAAINNLYLLGNSALPILSGLISNKSINSRVLAVRAIGLIGKSGIPTLMNILRKPTTVNEEKELRRIAVDSLVKIGKSATKELMSLISDNDERVKMLAIKNLYKWSSNKKEFLELLEKNSITHSLDKENDFLLYNQKTVFASGHLKELTSRFLKIKKLANDFQKKYKDFIGFNIIGSISKGYFNSESDLDITVISEGNDPFVDLIDKGAGLNLCKQQTTILWPSDLVKKDFNHFEFSHLFYGIFFGDHKKLLELQAKTIERCDEADWIEICQWIADTEGDPKKMMRRFNLTYEELENIQMLYKLTKIPPPLEEVKKIIKSRINLANKKEN